MRTLRSTWHLMTWGNAPVTLHWTVFLGLPWLYFVTRSLLGATSGFVALFFVLLAHELGHATVAKWRRVRVHGIKLYLLHGACTHDEPYYEEDDVRIAWGGVAAQLVVLAIASAATLVVPRSPLTAAVFRVLIETNLFMMLINLIPVAPFDGVKAWRALPLLRDWASEAAWTAKARHFLAARRHVRTEQLEAKSARIATEIIEKLKKGDSRTPK